MKLVWVFLILFVASIYSYGAQVELLVNPGFEDGVLDPWDTHFWSIASSGQHSGDYCAYSAELTYSYIWQDFDPVDVSGIVSITIWLREFFASSAIIILRYLEGNDELSRDVPDTNWNQYDFTSDLRDYGSLYWIEVHGIISYPPTGTYIDDVSILYDDDLVGVRSASLGEIKAVYK